MSCEHKYKHLGLQYADGDFALPGSSAVTRYYAHVFFCSKCLSYEYHPVEERERDRSYSKIREGATLGDARNIVPSYDRRRL